jgi:hypothetical protein
VSASERSEEPCELPGLAQRPFAGRVLRSKTEALGWKPQSVEDPPWRLLYVDGHLFAHEASLVGFDNLRIVNRFPIGLIQCLCIGCFSKKVGIWIFKRAGIGNSVFVLLHRLPRAPFDDSP